MPYPGFPTDAQPPVMAVMTAAEGTTMFIESIFTRRYQHVGELARLGADIRVDGRTAIVDGVPKLHGASVSAADLRGGAALVVAALGIENETRIAQLHHIDRGYEDLERRLSSVGASVLRSSE
jgi:UDP-N-acetylglucosamine 1-carboxyvinyltransferase